MVKKIYSKPEITVKELEAKGCFLDYIMSNSTVNNDNGGWAKGDRDDSDWGDEW
ncbi:MAG: hypothetical protein IKR98_05395 [Bacteroidaceae bacterium]|nr:hypothetical protein [Bacteroidaceae bacterium]